MRTIYLTTAFICLGWTVKAQDSLKTVQLDEVVITGTKTEVPVEKSGKTIFKISRKEIEESSGKTVSDLLNEVPGVQMDGNFGPMGTNIGYFIRGASSKRTLILIDGVPFNDASGIDQTYDLRLLNIDQVESIEVLKGGLSTLYGTGAAAGVISIKLKDPGNEALAGQFGAEYGSFNSFRSNLNVNGRSDKLTYMFNGGYQKSDGFSAALDETGSSNFDDDGFEGVNFLGRLDYKVTNDFSVGVTGALDGFTNDYDQGAFNDGNNFSEYAQLRVGLSPKFKWSSGILRGNIYYSKLDRLFNSPDFLDPNARFIDEYDAKNIQADVVVDQKISANVKLIGGLNFQGLSYAQPALDEESFRLTDPYVSFVFDQSNFTIQAGGRLNLHSEYGSNFVYNFNPSYLVELASFDVKLFTSYSTSFITPSLFQLFGPFGANPDLDPEKSQTAEGGVALVSDLVKFDFVYFYRKDKNLIQYLTDGYANSSTELETRGVELNGAVSLTETISLQANYTFVNALNGDIIFRVPSHKIGASLNFEIADKLKVRTSYLYTGDMDQPFFNDETFTTDIINTESFDLVDISGSYLIDNFRISGSLNNVFDEEYVAIYGFNSIGRNYNLGVSYSF